MTKGGWTALGAAAVLAAASARAEPVCELARVDRARTTAQRCLTCHDGTAGTAVPFQMRADGLGMSHPVGIDYAAAAARQPARYRSASALPPEVPLVQGRVECTTCHDGRSPDPERVADVRGLCTACHLL